MDKYTRYVTGTLGWVLLILGLALIYSVLIGDGMSSMNEEQTLKALLQNFMFMFITVSGALLLFCTRVLTLMEAREDS